MNFELIEPEDFRKFADKSSYKSFYQTPEIAKLREGAGWTPYYFGVRSGNKLIAASLVVARPTFLGKSTFYAPGGPLLDYEDASLVNFFFKNLQKYASSHNGYLLHIEPYYELIERGRDGTPVENGFNHQQALKNLRNAGLTPCTTSDEPQYAFVIDIDGRTSDQLFADMKRNTRNHIRKAEKKGVKIRELTREELPIFKQITESTSKRRDFHDKPLSYYQQMYDLFHKKGQVKFLLAEASVAEEQRTELEDTSIEGGAERDEAPKRASEESVGGYDRDRRSAAPVTTGGGDSVSEEARLATRSTSRNDILDCCTPLSAAMFMTYGKEVIYLFSGSIEEYMKEYNAQYLIQWHMLKYAADHGFKRYNFYGIQGLPDKSSPDYGIYDFKKGFDSTEHGHVTELLGAHEMPLSHTFYTFHQLLHRLRHRK